MHAISLTPVHISDTSVSQWRVVCADPRPQPSTHHDVGQATDRACMASRTRLARGRSLTPKLTTFAASCTLGALHSGSGANPGVWGSVGTESASRSCYRAAVTPRAARNTTPVRRERPHATNRLHTPHRKTKHRNHQVIHVHFWNVLQCPMHKWGPQTLV